MSCCPQETMPFSPLFPALSPVWAFLLPSPQKACSSSPWRVNSSQLRRSPPLPGPAPCQQILSLRGTSLEAKVMGATPCPPCTWPVSSGRGLPAMVAHSPPQPFPGALRAVFVFAKAHNAQIHNKCLPNNFSKEKKQAAVHHNRRLTPRSTPSPPPPAHPVLPGRRGRQWTSLGGRSARQASPFLLLWAAWGSLHSISLMNSDSPGKHLFAQNVRRGGVGEWRRRPPGRCVPPAARGLSCKACWDCHCGQPEANRS